MALSDAEKDALIASVKAMQEAGTIQTPREQAAWIDARPKFDPVTYRNPVAMVKLGAYWLALAGFATRHSVAEMWTSRAHEIFKKYGEPRHEWLAYMVKKYTDKQIAARMACKEWRLPEDKPEPGRFWYPWERRFFAYCYMSSDPRGMTDAEIREEIMSGASRVVNRLMDYMA